MKCTRCGGKGIFYTRVHNSVPIKAIPDDGICYRCNGSGIDPYLKDNANNINNKGKVKMKYGDVTTKYLKDCGFEQIERLQEPNINDIAYSMSIGMYEVKLEISKEIYCTAPYYESNMYYYGSKYKDTYQYEIMYYRVRQSYIDKHNLNGVYNEWTPCLRRKTNIKKTLVSNYCGD